MTFRVGTRVVYPVHGIADVIAQERHTIDGLTRAYLVLSVEGDLRSDALTLRVPVERLDEIGVRNAVSAEDAAGVLEVLAVQNPSVPANWSRRFKSHQEKLRTGDVYACAEVVRNLTRRLDHKKLGPAESTMYRTARSVLAAELAVSFGISDDEADERVDRALAGEG